ncbi:MAG TPA: DMT family transporter [Pelomicrobium sp.]|nr:DMT family transporter [Pelomicrobium sp.]
MTLPVLGLVLLGAALHAVWNALVRSSPTRVFDAVAVAIVAGMLALPALAALPLPAPASWPQLGASVALHALYFTLVGLAYRGGSLGVAYPIMRGSPPLVTAAGAALLFDEPLTAAGWLAVTGIVAGVFLLGTHGVRGKAISPRAAAVVAANVAVIVTYTLVDASGVRASGSAAAYTGWMFFLTGATLAGIIAALPALRRSMPARPAWGRLAIGGACTLLAYGIALWAMTQAPVALVAALRETSILFAAAIAAVILQERFTAWQSSGVALILGGVVAMRLA